MIAELYRIRAFRPIVRAYIERIEGGSMFSETLRRIQREQYGVEIGAYSYGPLLRPGVLCRGSSVGRYCSFAEGVSVYRRNHPMDRLSTHPFFFNPEFGHVPFGIPETPLEIGHDVWIGAHAIILPKCRVIETGAVIGAGAVVTKDVPAYAVVAGNPAKVIGYRKKSFGWHYLEREVLELLPELRIHSKKTK